MPTKRKSDSAILAEIRQVINDMTSGFEVRCYRSHDLLKKGEFDKLDANLATEIIEDLLNGKAGELTRDYRRTKADAAKAASAARPSP